MEHRWGRRVDCQIPVVVEAIAHVRLKAHIRNLSLTGAFLETSTEIGFPPTVCLRFEPASATPYHRHRIWAHVVRQTREGLGLEWTDFAPRLIRLHFALPPEGTHITRLMGVTRSDPAPGVQI
jgi:hypothetical protein